MEEKICIADRLVFLNFWGFVLFLAINKNGAMEEEKEWLIQARALVLKERDRLARSSMEAWWMEEGEERFEYAGK